MLKSRKMSRQSIAILSLSILLALAVVFGVTAAWFTDSDSQQGSITMGILNLKLQYWKESIPAWQDAGDALIGGSAGVPGDEVLPKMQIVKDDANTNVNVFIRVKVTISGYQADGSTPITAEQQTLLLGTMRAPADTYWYKHTDDYYYYSSVETGATVDSTLGTYTGASALSLYDEGFKIDESVGDDYMKFSLSITVSFEAIQVDNQAGATIGTVTGWSSTPYDPA